jgi:hypothetical protein
MKIIFPTIWLALATLQTSNAVRGTASQSKKHQRKLGKSPKKDDDGGNHGGLDNSINYSGNPLPAIDQ